MNPNSIKDYDIFELVPNDNNIEINYQFCRKKGNVVTLVVSFTPKSNISAYTILFNNLPHTTKTMLQSNKWSKGGSREHRDVVILPRDCE